jgi:23S rRNA (cytidine1920-2'-O)/16S rRNA (cytidine1409-2'-O)-methyltransferase
VARQRADLLLVSRGVFDSRAKARAAIEAGGVVADGKVVAKPAEMLDEDAAIEAAPAHRFVGRGGLKLDHALAAWPVSVAGRVVMDLGASTGGFTQVALERGAARVYAVDVGRGQLHPSLRDDPRVVELSGQDVRGLDVGLAPQPPQLLVSDLSFISLTKALPAALALAAPGADLVCLVKPQFEAAGPEEVGKGGVVKDPALQQRALSKVAAWLAGQGWTVRETADSPILGGDGNREFLLWATRVPL